MKIESITTHKQKILITFDSWIKMEWFKAFHAYVNLENQFQIFVSKKSDFFRSAWIARVEEEMTSHAITF